MMQRSWVGGSSRWTFSGMDNVIHFCPRRARRTRREEKREEIRPQISQISVDQFLLPLFSLPWPFVSFVDQFLRAHSFLTGFSNRPIRPISTMTVSPSFIQTGGFRAMPTPCGVPVRITAPGRRVMVLLRLSIRAGTSKIMSPVVWSCIVWPLRIVLMLSELGSGISSLVTIHGPSGQNPSKLLPRANCPPPSDFSRCQSRAETSLAQV